MDCFLTSTVVTIIYHRSFWFCFCLFVVNCFSYAERLRLKAVHRNHPPQRYCLELSFPLRPNKKANYMVADSGRSFGIASNLVLSRVSRKSDLRGICQLCINSFFDEGASLHSDMLERGSSLHRELEDCRSILQDRLGIRQCVYRNTTICISGWKLA
jgi:hypothetical protein